MVTNVSLFLGYSTSSSPSSSCDLKPASAKERLLCYPPTAIGKAPSNYIKVYSGRKRKKIFFSGGPLEDDDIFRSRPSENLVLNQDAEISDLFDQILPPPTLPQYNKFDLERVAREGILKLQQPLPLEETLQYQSKGRGRKKLASNRNNTGNNFCPFCGLKFQSKFKMEAHFDRTHLKDTCQVCSFRHDPLRPPGPESAAALLRHYEETGHGHVEGCSQCDSHKITSWPDYLTHIVEKHESVWTCRTCYERIPVPNLPMESPKAYLTWCAVFRDHTCQRGEDFFPSLLKAEKVEEDQEEGLIRDDMVTVIDENDCKNIVKLKIDHKFDDFCKW